MRKIVDTTIFLLFSLGRVMGQALQNARVHRQQREQLNLMDTLLGLREKLAKSATADDAIDLSLEAVHLYFKMRWCILRLIDKQTGDLELINCSGLSAELTEKARLVRPEGTLLGEVIQKGKTLFVEDMEKSKNGLRLPYYAKEMRSIAVAPITSGNETIGTLKVYSPFPRRWSKKDVDFLTSAASLLGLTLSDLRVRDLTRQRSLMVILSLTRALEARDKYTRGHSERVAQLALACAKILGLNEGQTKNLGQASLVHDIGKVGIPDSILSKPGHLSQKEWEEVKKHSMAGYDIAGEGGLPSEVLLAVRHHHENWDGSGYPDGLKGEKIPLLARVIRVADVYDALTSERPYRKPLLAAEAIEILRQEAGRQLDPCIAEAFLQIGSLDAAESKKLERKTTAYRDA